MPTSHWLSAAPVVLLSVLCGCHEADQRPANDRPEPPKTREIPWVSELVGAENLILKLTIELKRLTESVNELALPNADARTLFADHVGVMSLVADNAGGDGAGPLQTTTTTHKFTARHEVSADDLSLWQPVLGQIETFRHARFYFVNGRFSDGNRNQFKSQINFDGLARHKAGGWIGIHAVQQVTWQTAGEGEARNWKISDWQLTDFKTVQRNKLLFREVTTSAIPPADQLNLNESIHDQFIARSFRDEPLDLPYPELEPYFATDATMFHPSVSVVDINDDGWDDLYVTTRWHKNRLFVNQGDGTFVNMAKKFGLDRDRTCCALFVDLDNDGDKDAFLGRCFVPSLLLINENGKFVDRTSESISEPLPGFITSASAADYDNDGLIDLYLCSYTSIGSHIGNVETASKFMPPAHAKELIGWFVKASPADLWLDRPGPPNRLLKNLGGGKFKKSTVVQEVWANTFQSTWSDYDQDGDVDLYISNDFAPDYLFRNDGQRGFTDVTRQAGGPAMGGYGMGVTWGDYDNDGWQDLYVSNMYSKAGKRIIGQMQTELDSRYLMSANGNRLFRNLEGRKFELVSGEGPDDVQVTKAGWSWGGQFCDFDNDGWLDLYVASGFYTAPQEITCHTDL